MGIAKDGSKKDNFQRGVELRGCFSLSLSVHFGGTYAFTIIWL